MASKTRIPDSPPVSEPPLRSASGVPLRAAVAEHATSDTRTPRIPLADARPSAPDARFRPSAFSGEAVPFQVVAFREGHDAIGVHLRLTSPSGAESLHRLSPLGDGYDRWRTLVALVEQGVWRFRFEAFADDFASWEHAAELKIAAGVDAPLMREIGARLFTAAATERDRGTAQVRALTAAATALRDAAVTDDAALIVVRDPALAAFFRERPVRSLVTVGDEKELLVEREWRESARGTSSSHAPRARSVRSTARSSPARSERRRNASRRSPPWGSTCSICPRSIPSVR